MRRGAIDKMGRIAGATLASTVHPHPTYADGVWNASITDVRPRLSTPLLPRISRTLVSLRRTT